MLFRSKEQQLQLEAARIAAQKEIAAMQVGATAAAAKDKLQKQMEAEGVRMGIDAAKHRAQVQMERRRGAQDMAKHHTTLARQQTQQKPEKKGNE